MRRVRILGNDCAEAGRLYLDNEQNNGVLGVEMYGVDPF
jgi:hypothetical protein